MGHRDANRLTAANLYQKGALPATSLDPHSTSPTHADAAAATALQQVQQGVQVVPLPTPCAELTPDQNQFVLAYFANGCNPGRAMQQVDPMPYSNERVVNRIHSAKAQAYLSDPIVFREIQKHISWCIANMHHLQIGALLAMHQLATDPLQKGAVRIEATKQITAMVSQHHGSVEAAQRKHSEENGMVRSFINVLREMRVELADKEAERIIDVNVSAGVGVEGEDYLMVDGVKVALG